MSLDVAIITGWSNIGGSTESFVNLTNALNNEGIDTKLFGPHKWHLDKCNGGLLDDFTKQSTKNIIWHFLGMPIEIEKAIAPVNNILSCHEHEVNKVFDRYNIGIFNKLHFVSDKQKQYHLDYSGLPDDDTFVVIPNLLDPKLIPQKTKPVKKIGGVIGSIDKNKQTHIAIKKALKDGCDEVKVFGAVTDHAYANSYVSDLMNKPKVTYHGVVDDKNLMYSLITDVYHYSLNETWGYIKAECDYLGIPFHSNKSSICGVVNSEEIVNSWKEVLIL